MFAKVTWRYIPLQTFGPWHWMFTHFGHAGSWLYCSPAVDHGFLFASFLERHNWCDVPMFPAHGVVRLFGFEVEWWSPHALLQFNEYFDGLLEKEFSSPPIPSF